MNKQINKQNRQCTYNVLFCSVRVRIVAVEKQQSVAEEKLQSVTFVLLTYIELSEIQKCSVLTWKYNEGPSLFSYCSQQRIHSYVLT